MAQRFKVSWVQPGLARRPLPSLPRRPWGSAAAALGCLERAAQAAAEHAGPVGHTGVEGGCPRPRDRFGRVAVMGGAWGAGISHPTLGEQTSHPAKPKGGWGAALHLGAPILGWQRGIGTAGGSPELLWVGGQVPAGSRVRMGPHHRHPKNDENKMICQRR